jgi:2-methylcitrate dehydratase PrpD
VTSSRSITETGGTAHGGQGDAPGTPTEAVARYVAGVSYPDLPAEAIVNAKTAILDCLGVSLAGHRTLAAGLILDYVSTWAGVGTSSVVGADFQLPPEQAAFANGYLAHVQDYDDRGHASTHTLPVALALGEEAGVSGRDLLVAYVVGREVRQHLDEAFRPGRAATAGAPGSGPGWRGWHETGVVGTIGAVATAAKVLGLDTARTVMAIGIAASLAGGLIANFGSATKALHAANAARNGVLAGILASRGFTADRDILGTRRGLVEAVSFPDVLDLSAALEGLVSFSHLATKGVRVKPYPACTGVQRYIESALHLRRLHGLDPEAVARVTVGRVAGQTSKRDYPSDELECKFSPAFVAVAALISGDFSMETCNNGYLARADVQEMLARTTYEDAPEPFVRVETVAGATFEASGLPVRDLTTPEEIREKFHRCADPRVGPRRAEAIVEAVDHLETVGSVTELTSLVSGGVPA